MEQIGNLQITAINVNSFNMSTVHNSNAKCHLKIEGITSKSSDIILMSDCFFSYQIICLRKLGAIIVYNKHLLFTDYYYTPS